MKVFDGPTGAGLAKFDAFGPSHTGGVNAAAGDTDGDGFAGVIGPGSGRPRVWVFGGADLGSGPPSDPAVAFATGGPAATGGSRVAAKLSGAGGPLDIVATAGRGGGVGGYRFTATPGERSTEVFALDQFPDSTGSVFVG